MLLFRSIRSARLVLARPGGYQTASASRKFQSRDTSIHRPFLLRSRSENSTRTWRRTPILVPMVSDGWKGGQLGTNNLAMMPMSKNLDNLEEMGCPENVALVPRQQKPRRKSWKDGVPMRQATPPRRLPVGTRHSAHRGPGLCDPNAKRVWIASPRLSHLIVASHRAPFAISNHQKVTPQPQRTFLNLPFLNHTNKSKMSPPILTLGSPSNPPKPPPKATAHLLPCRVHHNGSIEPIQPFWRPEKQPGTPPSPNPNPSPTTNSPSLQTAPQRPTSAAANSTEPPSPSPQATAASSPLPSSHPPKTKTLSPSQSKR